MLVEIRVSDPCLARIISPKSASYCCRSACHQGKLEEEKLRQLTRGLLTWWCLKLSAQQAHSEEEVGPEGAASGLTPRGDSSSSPDTSNEATRGTKDKGNGLMDPGIPEGDTSRDVLDAAQTLGLGALVKRL